MVATQQFQPRKTYDSTITIASGSQTSNELDLYGCTGLGLFIPSNLRGIATLTVLVASAAAGTFVELTNAEGNGSADFTITLTASKAIWIDPRRMAAWRHVKLKGNTNASGGDLVIPFAAHWL